MLPLMCLAAGLLLAPLLAGSWPVLLPGVLLTLGSLLAAKVLSCKGLWPRRVSAVLGLASLLLVGLMIGRAHLHWVVAKQLPVEWDRQDLHLTFVVASLPKTGDRSVRFAARIQKAPCEAPACQWLVGKKLWVSWYHAKRTPNPGEVWQAQLRVKRPRGLVNPAGFDYHAWLLSEGYSATAYVRDSATRLGQRRNLAFWRYRLGEWVFAGQTLQFERFYRALLLGDKRTIDRQDWQVLTSSGTIHLLAISGLHVGLLAACGFGVGRFLARTLAAFRAGSNVGVYRCAPLMLSLALALIYAAIAGFSLPTLRAMVGCLCVGLSGLLARRLTLGVTFGMACCAVCLLQPFALFSPGFWLSFLAVFVLLWVFSGRKVSRIKGVVMAQWVLFVGLFAPLLATGIGVSLTAPMANLVAVPVVAVLVVPTLFMAVLLGGLPGVKTFVLNAVDSVFGWLWQWLELCAAFEPWHSPNPLAWTSALLLFLAGLLVLAPAGLKLWRVGGVLIVALLFAPQKTVSEPQFTVLDVGQGLAAVVTTQQSHWVFDTGAQFSKTFDIGSGVVAPLIQSLRTRTVNVVVSHGDHDHAGGLAGLTKALDINTLWVGERVDKVENKKGTRLPQQPCFRGQQWTDDQVTLEVLWPLEGHHASGNDASCVVLVTLQVPGGSVTILLPGDITQKVERLLVPDLPQGVDVLVASHHGSQTSSSAAFLAKLNPKFVVFSAGYKNRYRHPANKVVARVERFGAKTLNTAESGAIQFHWQEGNRLKVDRLRKEYDRLWY